MPSETDISLFVKSTRDFFPLRLNYGTVGVGSTSQPAGRLYRGELRLIMMVTMMVAMIVTTMVTMVVTTMVTTMVDVVKMMVMMMTEGSLGFDVGAKWTNINIPRLSTN